MPGMQKPFRLDEAKLDELRNPFSAPRPLARSAGS
jgi:hypothetical protein